MNSKKWSDWKKSFKELKEKKKPKQIDRYGVEE